MRKHLAVIVLFFTSALTFAQKPEGLSVYTWTREDISAGLIGGNFEQLNIGMKKLDEILKQNPT